ncbi:MAG: DM13 domain-containing protein [Bacteroidota bacterium]
MKNIPTKYLLVCCAILIASASSTLMAQSKSGTWKTKSYSIAGTWKISEENGKKYVTLDSKFKTKNAPDLKIFLSPLSIDELRDKTATKGSLLVAPLKKNYGQQKYEIPSGTDISKYKTILIHCEKYTVLWGGASL